MDPVGMTSMGGRTSSPRRMTAPLPCCFSIWAITEDSALSFSLPGAAATGLGITLPRALPAMSHLSFCRAASAPTGDQLSPSVSSRGLVRR